MIQKKENNNTINWHPLSYRVNSQKEGLSKLLNSSKEA